ncbi:16610_t:CDS:1, partial [Racocetra persica]
ARTQMSINMIEDDNFQFYINTCIQHRWNRMYSPILLVCWSLHPKYVLAKAIHPELITIIKKEASCLFEHLFPNKE